MRQLADLQVNYNKTFQDVIVKNKVNIIVVVFNSYSFLAGDKRKTLAEFEKEVMKLINQALLKVGLKIFFAFLHTKEFKDIGVFDDVVR